MTPQGQSHLSTHVIDHASAHNLMDKDKHLLGNQHCAHQLSLLRNKQQRKSRDMQTHECKRTNNERQIWTSSIFTLSNITSQQKQVLNITSHVIQQILHLSYHQSSNQLTVQGKGSKSTTICKKKRSEYVGVHEFASVYIHIYQT